jgi:hypothetical protein
MSNNKFYTTYSNTNQNHPLQQNSQNYLQYKKYVSIHSEDRDALAYPNSAEFEIELPEDIINISTMKLINWALPSNYDCFSVLNSNVTMIFKITDPYDYPLNYPDIKNITDYYIYEALIENNKTNNGEITIVIEEGFYNPSQLAIELQNKFNEAVTKVIEIYMINNKLLSDLEIFISKGGYTRFVIVYNNVSQKIWFGNQADTFTLLNNKIFLLNAEGNQYLICKSSQVADFANWGLPANLGLTRCDVTSKPPPNVDHDCAKYSTSYKICNNYIRFYYGDITISSSGISDSGYWLIPAYKFDTTEFLKGAVVQFIECPYKVNIFGPSYIYMEIARYNCIDETQPYNISKFTLTTNETNGIVNSAFAKIPVVATPLSQYYDGPSNSYKFFDPPVERIRRLKFRFRYHNGELVNFGVFEYSFTLEFTTLIPMINRAVNLVNL